MAKEIDYEQIKIEKFVEGNYLAYLVNNSGFSDTCGKYDPL